ncbi:MAG: tRNA nucleotidyltransferase/poly(A) polymerase family protein [Candidatus Acidiferrales bacterium]
MPDYMYLLESRLSPEQRAVLLRVQELARAQDSNVYLTGGAVRDLISGMPLRDLDFTVEGNPVRMVRELEKGGARTVVDDEHLRHYELIFVGDVDGSISAARDEVYARPGAKPEVRWSTVMEDLRRRDFSINAVAISLNTASRGLLLDPTNGLADLERREVRALSIHAFTNQPIRLLRALRFSARMGFATEPRTQEWFDLAIERGLQETMDSREIGKEVMDVGREENAAGILKLWESNNLLGAIHPKLQRKRPDYDGLARLAKAREGFVASGLRVRHAIPTVYYALRKLEPRMGAVLKNLNVPANEAAKVLHLPNEAKKLLQVLRGGKTKTPRDAYQVISQTPTELLAFMEAEFRNAKAAAKIRNYLQKWRPMRLSLPMAELDSLGVARGPKFDKILEQFFELQLRGKVRSPEDVTKRLKQIAGIKDEPKKKLKEEKKKRGSALEAAGAKRAAKATAEQASGSSGDAIREPKTAATGGKAAPSKAAKAPAARHAATKRAKSAAKSKPKKRGRR